MAYNKNMEIHARHIHIVRRVLKICRTRRKNQCIGATHLLDAPKLIGGFGAIAIHEVDLPIAYISRDPSPRDGRIVHAIADDSTVEYTQPNPPKGRGRGQRNMMRTDGNHLCY